MKKRIIFLLAISIVLGSFFTGCGTNNTNANSNSTNNTSNLPEALAGNHDETTVLDELKVSGVAKTFLVRNEQQYYMGPIADKDNLGVKINPDDRQKSLCFEIASDNNKDGIGLLSIDVSVPIIRNDDKVYVNEARFGVSVKPLEFIGYSPLCIDCVPRPPLYEKCIIMGEENGILNSEDIYTDLSVYLSKGGKKTGELALKEIHKLNYGQEITISWYDKNHKSNSWTANATYSYYEYSGEAIELEATGKETIDEKKYSIFDLNSLGLKPGFYTLCCGDEPQSIFVIQ